MKKQEIIKITANLLYELKEGEHTFHQCECGRKGCRIKCYLCLIEELRK